MTIEDVDAMIAERWTAISVALNSRDRPNDGVTETLYACYHEISEASGWPHAHVLRRIAKRLQDTTKEAT